MTLPTFEAFYDAVHSTGGAVQTPFPWQSRLAADVLANGWRNLLLDLPTGTGKTSAFDIALYCLACAPDRMPRRTVLVVDRRIVVDQAGDHARLLLHRLGTATSGPAKQIADGLRKLTDAGPLHAPFRVAVMRGGMPRDNDWARRPDQPVLGVSTVDQVGSRLLFRGYGISRMSASIHAGLIGNDTLILLDEVHLSVPFAETLDAIQVRYRTPRDQRGRELERLLPERFCVVPMSATIREVGKDARRFGLGTDDRHHPVLERRLTAHKKASLLVVKVTGDDEQKKLEILAQRAVEDALKLQAAGARVVGVVLNRVDCARRAHRILADKHAGTTGAMLVTGRMRPVERDWLVRDTLLQRAGASRVRSADEAPFIVVATQCIEAGADLDLDGIVTECASLDALRQRFGRVDRRGLRGETQSIILVRSDQAQPDAADPVYGNALASTWSWLGERAAEAQLDFGIAWLPSAVDTSGQPLANVLANPPHAPVLMPAHLDAWAQTSIRIAPEPEVALWLHGPKNPTADVQIVWRALALSAPGNGNEPDPDSPAWEAWHRARAGAVSDVLEAVRPSALESVTVPFHAARRWLAGEPATSIADVIDGDASDAEDEPRRRRPEGGKLVGWRWDGTAAHSVTAKQLRPGDVIVVDVARGGMREGSFDPDSTEPVLDLGDLAQTRGRGIATIRLDRDALGLWKLPDRVLATMPTSLPDESERELKLRICEWVRDWTQLPDPALGIATLADRQMLHDAFTARRARLADIGAVQVLTARIERVVLGVEADLETYEAISESADSSFQAGEVSLRRHSGDVRGFAAAFGKSVGLGDSLCRDLSLAGWLHDIGKADPRFQRWLVGGDQFRAAVLTEPLAKSGLEPGNAQRRGEARRRAGYPDGYRHELLSLAMIEESEVLREASDPDLVKHLVSSHHGWCRPFAAPTDDEEDIPVTLSHDSIAYGATTRHRLARLDGGPVDRFWRLTARYGWWGLAWLEAILRLADHRASELADEVRARDEAS
jgi:CRISPR-associated endonuclease/helicase Cas3